MTLEFESTIDEKELNPSKLGAKYVMGITDDATRFRWPFLLKKRSDAIHALKFFYKFIKNRGFEVPAYVHSDNEFRSKILSQSVTPDFGVWLYQLHVELVVSHVELVLSIVKMSSAHEDQNPHGFLLWKPVPVS